LISTLVGNLHQCPHDDRPNDDHAYHHGEQVHLVQISVHQSASAWYQLIRGQGLGRARETDLPKPFASDVSIDQPNDVGNANAKPSLRPTLAAFAPLTLAVAATRNEGANTMIIERGARPDALPDAHARHITPFKWKPAVRLIVAALVGAVLGIAAGYSVQLGWFIMIIWALVGAGVVGGAVYGYRIFR
jgi:hypothetical protein